MSQQDEIERIKRIRDQQIQARDPTVKQRQVQGKIATKYQRTKSREHFVRDTWANFEKVWKGVFLGGFLGVLVMVILPQFVPGKLGLILGIGAIPLLAMLGALFGAAFDWRDNIRDHMK